jgi:hypothetical protein
VGKGGIISAEGSAKDRDAADGWQLEDGMDGVIAGDAHAYGYSRSELRVSAKLVSVALVAVGVIVYFVAEAPPVLSRQTEIKLFVLVLHAAAICAWLLDGWRHGPAAGLPW